MVRKATNPGSRDDCFKVVLQMLRRAAQTESQMREKLGRQQFEEPIIQATIEKLIQLGLINDEKYAHDYVAYRTRTSPLGKYNLSMHLIKKGIHKDVAREAALDLTREEEEQIVHQMMQKKLRTLSRYPKEEQKNKLMRFLASRGFSIDVILNAIKAINQKE